MSGQVGFVATDPTPPMNGYEFDGEDIDELGLDLCIRVADRIGVDPEFSAGAVHWFTRRLRDRDVRS